MNFSLMIFSVSAVCRGGGPSVVVSTAAFHARVRGSVPGLGGFKETKMFLPHPRVKVSIVGSLRDREVACSASDRQGANFESCVWRTVSSQSSHHPQEVLLAQFSLYVHKSGLKPDLFHFIFVSCLYRAYNHVLSQQTRHIVTMMVKCWICVAEGGPTLSQHWFNVLCLLDVGWMWGFPRLWISGHIHSLGKPHIPPTKWRHKFGIPTRTDA